MVSLLLVEDGGVAPGAATTLPAQAALPPPAFRDRIGRYQAEGLLGSGGMGVVIVARDPELGRQVAIKFLRASEGAARDAHRARLIREAKAMAALSHPNVVTIYDVGEDGGEIYLAMELVRGKTLRHWLRGGRRSWREVLAVFVQAARGLAAAHELGIVHRDFKPENVFVGDDGRVRVGDFGLARSAGRAARVPDGADGAGDETQAGAVLGTVRYMAPEQIEGRADARTDQFSFCVSLYEALYGQRPWSEATIEELRAAFQSRRQAAPPPPRARVPAWLGRIVARGLRIDPGERFDSMAALLRAMTDDRVTRRRRLFIATAGAGLVASLAGAFIVGQRAPADAPEPCRGGPELLARVYGPTVTPRVTRLFAGSQLAAVQGLGDRVVERLDAYAREWLAAHADACEATVVRREQSAELMDLRMACLDERLRDLGALLRTLDEASPQELSRAVEAVGSLEPVESCSDAARLRARGAPVLDAKTAADAEAVRARVVESRVVTELGGYARALEIADAAVADAVRVKAARVEGEARFARAKALIGLAKGAEATAELHKAAALGDATRDDELAAEARTELVYSIGYREAKLAESEQMVPYADAAIQRLGGSPLLTARLLFHRSSALSLAQKHEEALPLTREALTILMHAGGDELLEASLYNRLGTDLKELARYKESLEAYDRALEIRERVHGPDHPTVALVLSNRGGTLRYLARYDEALADLQRALKIREATLGPEHVEVAANLTNLANTQAAMGRLEEAHRNRERALAIIQKAVAYDHPFAVTMRKNYVDSLVGLHRDAEALKSCDEWLPGELEKRPDTRITANLLLSCAVADLRARRDAHAWELFRKADAVLSKATPDEPGIEALSTFARELVARGKPREAVTIVERTLALRQKLLGEEHPKTAESRALLEAARTGRAAR